MRGEAMNLDNFDFGTALQLLEAGHRVRRSTWANDCYLWLSEPASEEASGRIGKQVYARNSFGDRPFEMCGDDLDGAIMLDWCVYTGQQNIPTATPKTK
jgi:hypothetical protein